MENSSARIVIVHHSYTWTNLVEGELCDFLLPKTNELLYITHPFRGARDGIGLASTVKRYEHGVLVSTVRGWRVHGPEVLFFIKDVLYTLWTIGRQSSGIDIYVGVDNLNALTGIILRRFGKVKKVIFYVIDYVPQRFSSRLMNRIYHWVDRFCVRHADYTWNLSAAMVEARHKTGMNSAYDVRQITVPVGCHPQAFVERDISGEIRIAFLGILNKDQGIADLIEQLPALIKALPQMRLMIIGSGELALAMSARVIELGLQGVVTMKGFVKDDKEVLALLALCHVGIAPYPKNPQSFKQFTDPGKIKSYLSVGLPVVMTNISPIARQLVETKSGLSVESPDELPRALESLFSDADIYESMSKNARTLAQSYEWQSIFRRAFLESKISLE